MSNFILTESQLKFIRESHLGGESLYNDGTQVLNEEWWNTIGDIVGIVDPTGVVDLVNGLDYIRQGEYFFGFLSMIAIIPYVGDVIAKPIMGVSKGSKAMKGVNSAMKLVKDGGKTADAGKLLADAGKASPLFAKLLNTSISWGGKLKQIIDRIPGGKLTGGLRKLLMDWIDLFIGVAKQRKNVGAVVTNLAKRVKGADPATATALMKNLKTQLGKSSRTLRDYKMTDPGFMAKYVWPGASLRNRELTGLMRKTKFYAGLLDYLGVANFVGPEELSKKMGEENVKQKMVEYSKTNQGQQYWKEDMSGVSPENSQPIRPQSSPSKSSSDSDIEDDPFNKMLKSMLMGSLNPIPGI
jgi:hypothetical protein